MPFEEYKKPSLKDLKKWKKNGVNYLGLFASAVAKKKLLSFCQLIELPIYENVKCHHITLLYKPKTIVIQSIESTLGKEFAIKVTGYGSNEYVSALRVEIAGMQSDNVAPHITMSVSNAEGASAKMSNDLDYEDIDGPEIQGTLAFYGRGKEYTHIPWK